MQESISNSEISLLNIDNNSSMEDIENMRLEGNFFKFLIIIMLKISMILKIFSSFKTITGWLSIPYKQNIRRYGWRKQYVVVSSRKGKISMND
jgi:hypothetical protein